MKHATRERFEEMTNALCGGASASTMAIGGAWFDILAEMYGQPHRHYHTMAHIDDCLRRADQHGAYAAVQVALWFHDAVYEPGAKDNEERSAVMARAYLESVGQGEAARDTAGLILTTTHKDPPPDGSHWADAATLMDIDMSGFADDWATFDRHNTEIRREFSRYTDEQYRAGRLAFLANLMARPQIYYRLTDLEGPARANIKRHMAELLDSR